MKLYKALKLKKKLVGEITDLKQQIKDKNSYLVGSKNGQKFSVDEAYVQLLEKIEELVNLKFVINEANKEIQQSIFTLSEFKALLAFWKEVSVTEGTNTTNAYSEKTQEFCVQVDEAKRNVMVADFQKKIDALQETLDVHNFNTEIAWGDE